MNERFFMSG